MGEIGVANGRHEARHRHRSPRRLISWVLAHSALARVLQAVKLAFADALERRRLFVLIPFAVILGLIAYRWPSFEPDPWAVAVVGLLVAGFGYLARRSLVALRLTLIFGGFWAGFALLALHGALFGTTMLAHPVYGTFEARVDALISSSPEGVARVIISDISPREGARDPGIRRARLFVREGPQLAPGDLIRGDMRFDRVPGPVVPGGFDAQFHGYFDSLGAYGNTLHPPQVIRPGEAMDPLRLTTATRQAIGTRIDAALDQPASGVARALMVGDQSGVDETARLQMATAGLAHILAISGLHLTLVAGGVFAVVRMALALSYRLGQALPLKKLAAIAGIAAALAYLALSGASVSAIRATIMLVLVFGAILAGRQALTMRNVAFAAMVVLLLDPASVFRPSFQLSFSAVAALVGAYEMARRGEASPNALARVWRFFAGMAMTSFVAGTATALFAAYHFQQTAPLGIAGNILALPLLSFVVLPAGMAAMLLMPLGFEGPALHLMGWGLDSILNIAAMVSAWSAGLTGSPLINGGALVVALSALAWFSFVRSGLRLAGPLLSVPLIAATCIDPAPDILVADRSQSIAVRGVEGIELIAGASRSFAVGAWQETYQEEIRQAGTRRTCDSFGCIFESGRGYTVAAIKQRDAFEEDCRSVQLVITRLSAPENCRNATQVIDARDLLRGGTHWLVWNAQRAAFDIRPAITDQSRPWRAVD